ncbi:MAG TPA: permease [Acidimicrobiales bacterium]|nr:permease [Acidimicrobiales bacterium]
MDVWAAGREAFFMFWETLWALVLGFALSGAVQAFVSREQMQRVLGDHRPAAVARAGAFGMVSSSCSYAATAMAKSLFQKGADFLSAMVFMFASTNLVVELGVVLLILMGWQFALAEFVGGPIMIVLLVAVGAVVFKRADIEAARRRLQQGDGGAGTADSEPDGREPLARRVRSKAGWADAASYTMADLTMLRKELFIGYAVAGVLAVVVPMHAWNDVFMHGHGFWTTLENVLIGPFIAFISFVCSVGNVPMAAALWHGGISFGGVISFIFADLIALPLVLIYRKFYGTRIALRLFVLFWVVMAAAGLAVEGLFSLLGWVPASRPHDIVMTRFEWNYTTFLNIAFLGVFAVLWWLHRNRARLGGGQGYAIDPVCGMQVETAHAPAVAEVDGRRYWFCSDRCRERFVGSAGAVRAGAPASAIDPVCGMTVDPATAPAHRTHEGVEYHFCNPGCATGFDADPARYATNAAPSH